MKVAASLFSLFGRIGAISPITNDEIVGELLTRNYTTGEATLPVEPSITRAEAIRYAVNKGLDSYGRPRQAVTLTYLPTMDFNTIVEFSKTWAAWYLSGTQKAESYYMSGLGRKNMRGLGGRNMRGLGDVFTPGPPEPGFSGWGLLLTLLGQGVITYGNYLMYKQTMQQQGYSFPAMTPTSKEGYVQQIMQANPNLTYQQAMEIAYPGQKKEGTPTWVWVAGGVAAAYLLTQRRTA